MELNKKQLTAFFFLLLIALSFGVAEGKNTVSAEEEFRWDEALQEAMTLLYPAPFRDSLFTAKGIRIAGALRSVRPQPYVRGERLVYEVSWGMVRAGYGVVTITPDSAAPGLLVASACGMSNNFVGAFFKVRDCLYGVIDREGIYPIFFEEHLREGRYKADRWLLFDHTRGQVFTNRKDHERVAAPRFAQSLLSLFYYLRTIMPQPGDTFTVNCFVQKRNHAVRFFCIKREILKTELGEFSCVILEPELSGEGRVFSKRDKLRLWLTDDTLALPVLLRTKVKVGSISARLIRVDCP